MQKLWEGAPSSLCCVHARHNRLLAMRCHMGIKDSTLCHFNWTKASRHCFNFTFTSGARNADVARCQTVSSFWNRARNYLGRLAPLSLGQPSLVCKNLLRCLFIRRLLCPHMQDIYKAAHDPSYAPTTLGSARHAGSGVTLATKGCDPHSASEPGVCRIRCQEAQDQTPSRSQ